MAVAELTLQVVSLRRPQVPVDAAAECTEPGDMLHAAAAATELHCSDLPGIGPFSVGPAPTLVYPAAAPQHLAGEMFRATLCFRNAAPHNALADLRVAVTMDHQGAAAPAPRGGGGSITGAPPHRGPIAQGQLARLAPGETLEIAAERRLDTPGAHRLAVLCDYRSPGGDARRLTKEFTVQCHTGVAEVQRRVIPVADHVAAVRYGRGNDNAAGGGTSDSDDESRRGSSAIRHRVIAIVELENMAAEPLMLGNVRFVPQVGCEQILVGDLPCRGGGGGTRAAMDPKAGALAVSGSGGVMSGSGAAAAQDALFAPGERRTFAFELSVVPPRRSLTAGATTAASRTGRPGAGGERDAGGSCELGAVAFDWRRPNGDGGTDSLAALSWAPPPAASIPGASLQLECAAPSPAVVGEPLRLRLRLTGVAASASLVRVLRPDRLLPLAACTGRTVARLDPVGARGAVTFDVELIPLVVGLLPLDGVVELYDVAAAQQQSQTATFATRVGGAAGGASPAVPAGSRRIWPPVVEGEHLGSGTGAGRGEAARRPRDLLAEVLVVRAE